MASRYELEQELKKARKAVLTLGLSLVPYKMLFEDASQADKGFSFAGTVFGYTFRVLWFLLWLIISMTIIWFISIFKWIYYAIVLSTDKTKTSSTMPPTMPQKTRPLQPQQHPRSIQKPINTIPKAETKNNDSVSCFAIVIKVFLITIIGFVIYYVVVNGEIESLIAKLQSILRELGLMLLYFYNYIN